MGTEEIQNFLFWCTLINFGVLLFWAFFFVFARSLMYRIHSRFFQISPEHFDAIHYAGMAFYKLSILLFNLIPYFVLRFML